jgi:hypothetical protein
VRLKPLGHLSVAGSLVQGLGAFFKCGSLDPWSGVGLAEDKDHLVSARPVIEPGGWAG